MNALLVVRGPGYQSRRRHFTRKIEPFSCALHSHVSMVTVRETQDFILQNAISFYVRLIDVSHMIVFILQQCGPHGKEVEYAWPRQSMVAKQGYEVRFLLYFCEFLSFIYWPTFIFKIEKNTDKFVSASVIIRGHKLT